MNPTPPFRIQIRKVDRDEFTAYRWGELEDGEIVKRYDEGEAHFGPFDRVVERSKELFADGANPSSSIPWLRLWHNYGSQAHHPRADIVHPYLDRHLWGETGIVLTGALRGLVAPGSYVDTIDALHIGAHGEPASDTPLVVRYRIGDLPDGHDLRTEPAIANVVHPTVSNIITETLDTYQGLYVEDYVNFDRFVVVAMFENLPHCRVELTYDDATTQDWKKVQPDQIPELAAQYYNAG